MDPMGYGMIYGMICSFSFVTWLCFHHGTVLITDGARADAGLGCPHRRLLHAINCPWWLRRLQSYQNRNIWDIRDTWDIWDIWDTWDIWDIWDIYGIYGIHGIYGILYGIYMGYIWDIYGIYIYIYYVAGLHRFFITSYSVQVSGMFGSQKKRSKSGPPSFPFSLVVRSLVVGLAIE